MLYHFLEFFEEKYHHNKYKEEKKMKRTLVKELNALVGGLVRWSGFVQSIRDQKRMQFVILRDYTGHIQISHEKGDKEDQIKKIISSLTTESAITVIGHVVENKNVKLSGVEVIAESIDISSIATVPLPIRADSSLDLQMDWRILSLRKPENLLVFQIQTTMEQAMREFWMNNDFIEIHSPKLMATASESGAELKHKKIFRF